MASVASPAHTEHRFRPPAAARPFDAAADSAPDPAQDAAAPVWIRQARLALRDAPVDHFKVSPGRYWLDFLLALSIAYTAAAVYLLAPLGSWPQLAAFPIAVFWLYRLGSLVHEVCHLGHHEMRGFKVAWNVLVGMMTLT
ncbi:MAG: hypothetical protein WCJ21_08020, partial [Planctomycetota bacterium]